MSTDGMSSQSNTENSMPNFDLPILRRDPFLGGLHLAQATFAIVGDAVVVIRGAGPAGRTIQGIDWTRDFVPFGRDVRVDSDTLRFALEDLGL